MSMDFLLVLTVALFGCGMYLWGYRKALEHATGELEGLSKQCNTDDKKVKGGAEHGKV